MNWLLAGAILLATAPAYRVAADDWKATPKEIEDCRANAKTADEAENCHFLVSPAKVAECKADHQRKGLNPAWCDLHSAH